MEKTRLTVSQFEEFIARPENRDRRFELINGEVIEVSPTQEHGITSGNIYAPLWNFNRLHKLGHVMTETSYRMPDDLENERIPDVSFILGMDTPVVTEGAVMRMPDLAVEVKSPTNTYRELREKAAYYLANGSRMVWLVFPEKRLIEVYQPDADIQILTENDVLTGDPLLPGFRLPVRDVFAI